MMLRNRRYQRRSSVSKPSTPLDTPPNGTSSSRIPAMLQAVFLSSNRGNVVHEPPPNRIANRIFFGTKLRAPWGKKKNMFNGDVERNESSTSSNDDTIPTSISATSSASSTPTKYFQDIVVYPDAALKSKAAPTEPLKVTPQSYVDAIMKSRGYSTTKYDALKTAYYNAPTAYQKACYDAYIVRLVKEERDCAALQQLLVAGLSSNPCNAYGESLLHTICRLGNIPTTLGDSAPDAESSLSFHMLRILLNVGQVDVTNCVDDYGRTPLHDACWTIHPCWETITTLLTLDPTLLLLRDCRGALPLSYVPKKLEAAWLDYLSLHKDQLFPLITNGARPAIPSPLVEARPHSRPVKNPMNALSLDLARMVASGRITPDEVAILLEDDDHDEDDSEEGGSSVYADQSDEDEEEEEMIEVDDSSTILSAEGNSLPAAAAPKALGDHNDSDDDDDGSEVSSEEEEDDASDSDESSYAELEAIMQQFHHAKNQAEGRIGIARPHYGNEVAVEESSQATPALPPPTTSYYDAADENHELPMTSIRVPIRDTEASSPVTLEGSRVPSENNTLKAPYQLGADQAGLLEFSV